MIFISIDDNEVANLRKICDEIFGEENFINIISTKMKNIAGASGGGEDKRLKKNMEFVLIYSKDYDKFIRFKPTYKLTEIYNLVKYYEFNSISWKYTSVLCDPGKEQYITSTKDGDGNEIKIFSRLNSVIKSVSTLAKENKCSEKDIYYKYIDKIFTTAMPQSSIRTRVVEAIDNVKEESFSLYSIKYTPKTGKNKGQIYEQFYKGEKKRLLTWLKDVTINKNDKIYKKDLLGTLWDDLNLNNLTKEGDIKFENGKKPLKLLTDIISMSSDQNDIILDFFAGSGTTAHAVYEKNMEDGGNRKYILMQLPEPTQEKSEAYKAGFKNIADIGKERIRRAIKKIKEENQQQSFKSQDNDIDLGFKVFKLQKSHFKTWEKDSNKDQDSSDQIKMHLDGFIDPKASDEDLLYEILLKTGYPLTTQIQTLKLNQRGLEQAKPAPSISSLEKKVTLKTTNSVTINHKNSLNQTVYSIDNQALLICLERKNITKELIREMARLRPARVVFLDIAFENKDHLKTNAKETFASHGVLSFKTI